MLYTKFQGHLPLESFTIYGHGGHLGHVTWTIWSNVCFPIPWRCSTWNLASINQKVSEKMLFENVEYSMTLDKGQWMTFDIHKTELSKLLISCLTAVKKHLIKYYDTCYERDGINPFLSIKISNEVLNKLKSKDFKASTLSTYDFSTLYTMLPHHLMKDKLLI